MSLTASTGDNLKDDATGEQRNPQYAALARSFTRGLALYFSRPVRLFRPAKVSGWLFIQRLASSEGAALSPQFISGLVKQHGFLVIPRHFVPPLAINAALGMVLWSSYAEASSFLDNQFLIHPTVNAALSGAVAGGAQAVVAAPAENVRLVLEGASHSRWSAAWKDVFLGAKSDRICTKEETRRDARQVRAWMKDVGEMAGRGWKGWGWGCAKDICGFAMFFSVFDITRRTATIAKNTTAENLDFLSSRDSAVRNHLPRVVHGSCLVSGGVLAGLIYELVGRPFDVARRIAQLQQLDVPGSGSRRTVSLTCALMNKVREDGVTSFFSTTRQTDAESLHSRGSRMNTVLRTLGRVGPWGIGFLVWEAFGPGLAT